MGIAADSSAVVRIEMPVVVVDEAELVVHVFAREAEFVLLRHVAFRRDQPSIRPVFVQGAAPARFPEEGSDVLHRVVHAVEMLFHLRPVRLPARHGQDVRGLRFRGVPEVAAYKYRRFSGQVALRHLQVVPPKLKAASIILSDRGIAYHIQYFLPIGESIEIPFDNRFFDYTTKRNFIFLHIHKKP